MNTKTKKGITPAEYALMKQGYSLSDIRRVRDQEVKPPSLNRMKGEAVHKGSEDVPK